jgi:hypothetical protein
MNVDWIIEKFLDNEALLEEGKATVRAVVNELEGEGVTVSAGMVTNVQTVTRHVLAVQRAREHARGRVDDGDRLPDRRP